MNSAIHSYEDSAICPYCNHIHMNRCDFNFDMTEDQTLICDFCGKEFDVTQHISISYSTYKKEKPREEKNEQ